jgi:hypothetical protein
VDLVASLSSSSQYADNTDHSRETILVLWSGIDPRTPAAITKALDDAGIEYFDESAARSVLLPGSRDGIREIRVAGSNFEAAKKVLSDLSDAGVTEDDPSAQLTKANSSVNPLRLDHSIYNRVPEESSSEGDLEREEDDEPVPDDYVENFNEEEATVSVWSGEDARMAQLFRECLSNVGIGSRLESKFGKANVFVMAAAEKRAREVVREIEEGTPMA